MNYCKHFTNQVMSKNVFLFAIIKIVNTRYHIKLINPYGKLKSFSNKSLEQNQIMIKKQSKDLHLK